MTKHCSQKRRSHSKSKTARRGQHGGNLAGNPASAWGWVNGTVGNGWTQFMNSLTLQPGQTSASAQSNDLNPVTNLNANNQQPYLNANMSGGRKKRGHKKHYGKAKCGGSFMGVANQAIVPGTLLAIQQLFGNGKSRKNSKNFKGGSRRRR